MQLQQADTAILQSENQIDRAANDLININLTNNGIASNGLASVASPEVLRGSQESLQFNEYDNDFLKTTNKEQQNTDTAKEVAIDTNSVESRVDTKSIESKQSLKP